MTTTPDSARPGQLPSALIANLNAVLAGSRPSDDDQPAPPDPASATDADADAMAEAGKPVVLVTCADGIRSPGLAALVAALVAGGQFDVHVCAPDSAKAVAAHSISIGESVQATSSGDFTGAKAFEISGTAVDSVSLALSGVLFHWSKPVVVISGFNSGPNCGERIYYSGAVAAAREALIHGVPSLVLSLEWNKDESKESDFSEASRACMPLIHAAIRDAEKGLFPQSCLVNINVPSSPSSNKGFKLTRLGICKNAQNWQAMSVNRPTGAAHVMAMHQSMGLKLAQLGKDASAAGAARRINARKELVEVEGVGAAGKPEVQEIVRKLFRAELIELHEELDEDVDLKALKNGFISVTPLPLQTDVDSVLQTSVSDWLGSALAEVQETPAEAS